MRSTDVKPGMAVTLVKGKSKLRAVVERFQRVEVNGKHMERVRVKRLKSGRSELVPVGSLLPIEEFWRAEAAKKQYADDLKAVERQRKRLRDISKTGALFASEQGGMLRIEIPAVHAEHVVDILLRDLHGVA